MTGTNNATSRLFAALVVLTMLTVALPTAVAQTEDFGTYVQATDSDFRPTLTDFIDNENACRIDFGTSDTVTDDAFYLSVAGTASDVDTFDVRLNTWNDNQPGTLVTDSDTTEKSTSATCEQMSSDGEVFWVDTNNDGDFTPEDYAYISMSLGGDNSAAPTTLTASSDNVQVIRLTDTANHDAGTLVLAGEQDVQTYGGSGTSFGTWGQGDAPEFAAFDEDNSGEFTQGDWGYITLDPDTGDATNLPRLYDIRLTHPDFSFGELVTKDHPDFIPTLSEDFVGDDDSADEPQLCRIDFGSSGNLQDDGFYFDLDANADTDPGTAHSLDTFDIRVTEAQGNPPGELVTDANTAETARDDLNCKSNTNYAWIDADSDGEYDADDFVYVGAVSGASDTSVTGSSDTGEWWVRLTPGPNNDAGTVVFSGDQDLTSYGSSNAFDGNAPDLGYFDADNSGVLDQDDTVYLEPAATAGGPPDLFSVRVVTEDAFDFGSKVTADADDFVPTLSGAETSQDQICRQDFADESRITDDAFYLSVDNNNNLDNFDIRLTEYDGSPPGSLLTDGDTTEKQDSLSTNNGDLCTSPTVAWIDTDSDNQLTTNDYVYIGNDADTGDTVEGATDGGDWWVRLVPTQNHDAGTLVLSSHQDMTTFGDGQTSGISGEFAFFDADNDGEFQTGDWAYISSNDVSNGDTPSLYSVRLHGTFDVPQRGDTDDGTDDNQTDDGTDGNQTDGNETQEPVDSDGDGIADENDDCPNEAGVSANNGCPQEQDSDGDGIADEQDECPDEAGVAANNGCPEEEQDADGDGIPDADDECPDQAGTEANNGCPAEDTEEPTDNETDEQPEETPALGAIVAIALIGLAALLRRD